MAVLLLVACFTLTACWGDTSKQELIVSPPETTQTAEPEPEPEMLPEITIAFVGDMTFSRAGGSGFGDSDALFSSVAPILQSADIAFGNLETPLSGRGAPASKTFVFRGPTAAAGALSRAGFDIVSLANNHVLDYGQDAFADTFTALEAADVATVGGGANRTEAWAPTIIERNGATVAFLAFSEINPANFAATDSRPGATYTQDIDAITRSVAAAKIQADYVVVGMHWGVENSYAPTDRQVNEARAIIDAGATAVLAGHPHVLQPVEFYQGGLIAYSLGNFVFSPGSTKGRDSAILALTLTEFGPTSVAATPVYIEQFAPKLQTGERAQRILNILADSSRARGTQVELSGNTLLFKDP